MICSRGRTKFKPVGQGSRSLGQMDGPLRPGFASAERILSIRTGRPERMDRTSLCLKHSWPVKDMRAFAGLVTAAMTRKMLEGFDHDGGEGSVTHQSRTCSVLTADPVTVTLALNEVGVASYNCGSRPSRYINETKVGLFIHHQNARHHSWS
jgi:hypothetical protein